MNIGTIFITGISASGKSTLGRRLFDDLINNGYKKVKLVDGEEIRKQLGKHYGYTNEDRHAVSMEIAKIASDYNKKMYICIVCAISHLRHTRAKVREKIGNFMEIYLDCPVEVCAKRDYKGNYKRALAGKLDNFIGVTEPYELSDNPELVINTARQSIEKCSSLLLEKSLNFFNMKAVKIVCD